MYDLIGDIHGHAHELEALLEKLGYQRSGDGFRHTGRKVIFLGDFIDRGPHQRRVLQTVRAMIEAGDAKSVMGNHEFNAIAYFTPNGDGGYLRARNCKYTLHHQAFLDAFSSQPSLWRETIDWFKTLPLWLDLEGLRVVHACWDRHAIHQIAESYGKDALLTDELLHAASQRGTWQFRAVDTLLKGKEIPLPEGTYFTDKHGVSRHNIRMRWWGSGNTYKDLCLGSESAQTNIPDDPVQGDYMVEYGREEKPVFLGHYWMDGEPAPLADNVACLDYSVADPGGKLVAYRWNGESKINPDNFVSFKRLD